MLYQLRYCIFSSKIQETLDFSFNKACYNKDSLLSNDITRFNSQWKMLLHCNLNILIKFCKFKVIM